MPLPSFRIRRCAVRSFMKAKIGQDTHIGQRRKAKAAQCTQMSTKRRRTIDFGHILVKMDHKGWTKTKEKMGTMKMACGQSLRGKTPKVSAKLRWKMSHRAHMHRFIVSKPRHDKLVRIRSAIANQNFKPHTKLMHRRRERRIRRERKKKKEEKKRQQSILVCASLTKQ